MASRACALLLVTVLGACAEEPTPARGHIVVALTIDWEGVAITPDAVDALEDLRRRAGAAPITHFVSAAYYTSGAPPAEVTRALQRLVRPGDELAVHLHGWRSLVEASMTRDVAMVDEVVRLLRFERETWQLCIEKLAVENRAAAGASAGTMRAASSVIPTPGATTPARSSLSVSG
jgi:hypothetical protein